MAFIVFAKVGKTVKAGFRVRLKDFETRALSVVVVSLLYMKKKIDFLLPCVCSVIESFSKPRTQRRRERRQTRRLMSKTMAVYVRFESRYISLPSSQAKQQREMT